MSNVINLSVHSATTSKLSKCREEPHVIIEFVLKTFRIQTGVYVGEVVSIKTDGTMMITASEHI